MRLSFWLMAAGLSACSLSSPAEVPAPVSFVTTSQTAYDAHVRGLLTRRVEVDIPYTLRNPTGQTLLQFGCGGPGQPVLEKRVDGRWVVAWAAIELMCLGPPVPLAPGEVRSQTLRVVGYLPGQNVGPEFTTAIDGTYRLRADLYAGEEASGVGAVPVPLADRLSNEFRLD